MYFPPKEYYVTQASALSLNLHLLQVDIPSSYQGQNRSKHTCRYFRVRLKSADQEPTNQNSSAVVNTRLFWEFVKSQQRERGDMTVETSGE